MIGTHGIARVLRYRQVHRRSAGSKTSQAGWGVDDGLHQQHSRGESRLSPGVDGGVQSGEVNDAGGHGRDARLYPRSVVEEMMELEPELGLEPQLKLELELVAFLALKGTLAALAT